MGNSIHDTTRDILRSTYEATATSLAAMRGPGSGRPRRGNDKRAAGGALPSGQVASGGADGRGERGTRATPARRQTLPTADGGGSSITATALALFPSNCSPGPIQAGIRAW